VLAEVGTVVLQLELCIDEVLRTGLADWEAAFTKAAQETTRCPEEQEWLGVLARTVRFLTGDGRGARGNRKSAPATGTT
jgi:hypothetical protein